MYELRLTKEDQAGFLLVFVVGGRGEKAGMEIFSLRMIVIVVF